MTSFVPLFRNPHFQTIAGRYWPRDGAESRYPVQEKLYRTAPDVQVLVQSQCPGSRSAGDIVLVHGLEGSGQSGYMRSFSSVALEWGFAAHRFNMRTCGGTEHLCSTLYHAGLTADLLSVLQALRTEGRGPVFLVGFSLGGNVVMKLAGELGAEAASLIGAVCAVSTPLDLAACARRMAQKDNRVYQNRFVRKMRARLCATGRYRRTDFEGLSSIEEIDDRITAPSFGFGNAANYYQTQSAIRFLDAIQVPSLLIHAKDDTMVPFETVAFETARRNPRIALTLTEYGGHLGFIGRGRDRFWLDRTIMEWISRINGASA